MCVYSIVASSGSGSGSGFGSPSPFLLRVMSFPHIGPNHSNPSGDRHIRPPFSTLNRPLYLTNSKQKYTVHNSLIILTTPTGARNERKIIIKKKVERRGVPHKKKKRKKSLPAPGERRGAKRCHRSARNFSPLCPPLVCCSLLSLHRR